MKKVLSLLVVLVMTVGLLAGCGGGSSSPDGGVGNGVADDGKVYELKMSTQLADTHPMVAGFKELAARLKEKSGGRMGNYVEEMGIILAPYFADNYDEVLKVTESDLFKQWEQELAEEHGIRVLSFNWYDGPRHFLTNKPVTKPEDLKGQRIRTPGAPVWSESVKALGATPVSMPWTEVYTAVQQKAIDGAEGQHTASYTSHLYEVLKYIDKTAHFQLVNGIIVGEKWFQTLPEDLQQLLIEETKAVAAENARYIEQVADEFEQKMVEAGMEVVEVDLDAFKAAAEQAYEVLGLKELRDQIYAEIGKK